MSINSISFSVSEVIHQYQLPVILLLFALAIPGVFLYRHSKKLRQLVKKDEEWENPAKHDELTGVLNREAYKEIKEELNKKSKSVVFVMVDIDHFKEFNEEYGHDTADQLLKKAADILLHSVRKDDYVFRFGGDKFVLLLCNINGESEEYVKNRFFTVSDALASADQTAPAAHFSAGIFFSKNGLNNECYQIADAALCHSKKNGYAGCTIMDENKKVVCEYHDNTALSINMSKQKLQSAIKSGTWRIEIPEDGLPRMFSDDTMQELLGIERTVSPEECYEQWFSNIDPDYVSVVFQAVDKILKGKRAEVGYLWNHPTLGVRKIRCGGIYDSEFKEGKGMYGFHQDLSEIEVVMKDNDIQYMMNAMNDYLVCNIYIDLSSMRYTMIKQTEKMAASGIEKGSYSQLTSTLLETYVSKENQEDMRQFLKVDDLVTRINNKQKISCDFMDAITNEWQTARLLPVRYDSNGQLQSIMIEVISIDTEKREKLQQEQQLRMIRTAYKQMFSMTQSYLGIIDLKTKLLQRLDMDYDHVAIPKETPYRYDIVLDYAAEHSVVADEKDKFKKNASLEIVLEQLQHNHEYAFRVNRKKADGTTGLFAYHFCYYDDKKERIVCMIEEVTALEEKDSITEDINLQGFMRKSAYILEHQNGEYAMLHFDIKGFKAINAQFGFERGNQLLKAVFGSVKDSLLKPCAIARSSSDHFYCMVLKKHLDYREIIRLCKQNFILENTSVSITMQCGIYEIEDNKMTIRAMCDRARLAETALKDENTGCPYFVFTEELNKQYLQQKEIITSLDEAVKREEFYNYFQPIYDAKTKKLASAEALVRWIKADGQVVPPDAFIPALEENGQISIVDMFTGLCINRFQKERYAEGKKIIPISINLSRVDLYNDELLETLCGSVKAATIPCKYMRFEITESAYTEIPEHALQVMRTMREYGAKLLIDDFGKGYSSLGTLAEQVFDIVKLDMSFIRQIGKNARAEAVISASIDMAHKMDAQVIAEGVETQEQYEFLRDIDCDFIQGYYFSKPLPQAEFVELLEKEY